MQLVGPYLTTTSYKKRKVKITKSKQAEFESGWRERNVRLKQMSLPKETFEQYMEFVNGRCKTSKKKTVDIPKNSKTITTSTSKTWSGPTSTRNHEEIYSIPDSVAGPCSSKPTPIYTGTKILGIATMHKSNAVPVFSDEEIIDIARMRR
jgi:hypothetical protein